MERYDPQSGQWHQKKSMSQARLGHSGTRLGDGRILFVGGFMGTLSPTSSAEIYDPDLDTFTATGALTTPRVFHEATLLSDGRVLISGGQGAAADPAPVATEIYDPVSGQFSPGGDLAVARAFHTAVPLTDGRVLIVGGAKPASSRNTTVEATEIYNPATNHWSTGPTLHPAWMHSTVTLLTSGKVLIFGGEDEQGYPVSTVMLYE